MEVPLGWVEGLDVGMATLTVYLRTPGPSGGRRGHPDVQNDHRAAAGEA
jgi:hypothetical protein